MLKQNIYEELSYSAPRLLLTDKPLQDALLLNDSSIVSGACIRAAKSKKTLKKCRINQNPDSNQRRRSKAQEARQQLEEILATISEAKKNCLQELLEENEELLQDDEKMAKKEDEGADATKVYSLREVCSTYSR